MKIGFIAMSGVRAQKLSILLLTSMLSGCVVPSLSVSPARGTVLKPKDVAFIEAGHTTRSEIIAQLGPRFRETTKKSALAYTWETRGFSTAWTMRGFGLNDKMGETETKSWRALFVAFNEIGQVSRYKFVKLNSSQSLDSQLEAWERKSIVALSINAHGQATQSQATHKQTLQTKPYQKT